MTLCPPSPVLFPPLLFLPSSPSPPVSYLHLTIRLPQSPHLDLALRTGLSTLLGARPLPPSGVCVPGPPGLWRPVGAVLPSTAQAAAELSPAGQFGKHPYAVGTAPGQASARRPGRAQ